jgi:Pectate lyase superfamily protein
MKHESMLPDQAASRLVLNVKDFQATGNGSEDDTPAFAGALSKLGENGGGTLLIPSGTYVVADLHVESGTWIKGTGTPLPVLVKRPRANCILDISSSRFVDSHGALHDITVENVTLRGRSVEDGFSEHTHNFSALGVTRVSVRHVRFEAFQGDGIYLDTRRQQNGELVHNTDVKVSDNSFDGANDQNRNGASLIDCSHCILERNLFSHMSRPDMPGAIDIEPDEKNQSVRDIVIKDNTITGNKGGVGAISIVLNLKDFLITPGHITVENNRIENSKRGIMILWRGGPATQQTQSLDTVIRHNVVKDVDRPMTLDGGVGITVDNNDISDSRSELQIGCGFGAVDLRFQNNRFYRVGSKSAHGIMICGPLSDLVFERNDFADLGSGQRGGSAIYFGRGAATNVTFVANTFSSPNHITHVAVLAAYSASCCGGTAAWTGNVLHDRIQPGSFRHAPR